ncbi:hypothetical protein CL630_03515 [bacterium]|nr:hypothetical protein [bacterium]|tara:strand:+ start:1302 stop:2000 length:699 start_codon:yes stop_codon:yes gene_type:complete
MLSRLLKNNDEVFNKAFKYMLQAEQDFYRSVPPQMLTINLFKCIEIIINVFDGKTFNKKLQRASIDLNLEEEDITGVKKLKEIRNYGDVAHPRQSDHTDFYPPQFPIPQNVDFPNFWHSGLTSKVLLNYFLYVDSLIEIKLSNDTYDEEDEIISVNYGHKNSYYKIKPSVKNNERITPFIKKKLSEYFEVPYSRIRLRTHTHSGLIYQIKDHLDFELDPIRAGRSHQIIIPL